MLNPMKEMQRKLAERQAEKKRQKTDKDLCVAFRMLSDQDTRIEDLEKLAEDLTNRVRAQAIQKKDRHVQTDLNGEVLQKEDFFPEGNLPMIEVWTTEMEADRLHDYIDDLKHQIISLTVKKDPI